MVSQKQKLLAAGGVLAVGFGLALPFQRSDDGDVVASAEPIASAAASQPQTLAGPVVLDGQFSPQGPVAAAVASTAASIDGATDETAHESPAPAAESVAAPNAAADEIVTARPEDGPGVEEAPDDNGYRVHVIHNGDTLEKLAERYLGDRLRSLELFDLNRDQLENPHLLPIGAELRIPPAAEGSGE